MSLPLAHALTHLDWRGRIWLYLSPTLNEQLSELLVYVEHTLHSFT